MMSLVLLASAVLCLLAVAAELATREWIRSGRAYYVFPPGLRIRLHLDRNTFPELEPVVRFEINSDGERGYEVPRLAAGEKLYRVLVAGGSQPEGYFLDQDTSWPGALQHLLATREHLSTLGAAKVHVGSIARSGVGSEALDLVLERVLPRYPRLSAIVVLVGASDVLRWLEEGAPAAASSLAPTAELFRCHPEGPFGWRPRELALTELLRRAAQRHLRREQVHHDAGSWIGKARAMRSRAKVVHATLPDPAAMLEHFDSCLRRLIRRALAHADRVIVVHQSWFEKETLTAEEAAHMWHGGAGQAWREAVTTYYSIEVTSRLMALIHARAARVADELRAEQIDLRAILEPSLTTYYDFFHLTPAGAHLVAAHVAATLLDTRRQAAAFDGANSRCVGLRAS
jgi:lysophospholipase L1-like esterase